MNLFKKLWITALISFPLFSYANTDKDRIGKPGEETKISRNIEIETYDTMKFSPDKIEVKKGETIKFVVSNKGKLIHEFMIGKLDKLKKHAVVMQKYPTMKHAEKNAITVEPGQTNSIVWEFNTEGKVDFACLLPGHLEAGMVGTIKVNPNEIGALEKKKDKISN